MIKRAYWHTRFGFYLAAIGSACGLGNLWRFPHVVAENGGGAFVLLYVMLALLVGMPVLIGELMLGKVYRSGILVLGHKKTEEFKLPFLWVGRLSIIVSVLVLSYYAVISGWVLHFMVNFLLTLFTEKSHTAGLATLLSNGLLQMGLASVHLLFVVIVILKGLQNGLERWISYSMPIFTFLLLVLVVRSFNLDTSQEALRFLFYPDFTKLSATSLLEALGHVFFTLSVGFGTMVTFGSYLRESDHIPTAGFRVTLVDTVISLFGGFVIFSVALQASNTTLSDPTLLFAALPEYLSGIKYGVIFGFLFFTCLYLAALGASLGLMEVVVTNIADHFKKSRTYSAWVVGLGCLALASFPALSSTYLSKLKFGGKTILETLDSFLISVFLPLIALGVLWLVRKVVPAKVKEEQFIDSTKVESESMFPHWIIAVKYVAPAVIVLSFFAAAISFLMF